MVLNKTVSAGKQSGFTLIEIAIVLVIIGLLLGGVLKGQQLINTARVHALNNKIDGITSAWFSFSDRYRALPGDYDQASTNLPGITNNGDGNGLIDQDSERALVWSDLQAAGYITGNYPDNSSNIVETEYGCKLSICPDNGFGQGMVISYAKLQQTQSAKANELITGHNIPVNILAELDRKVDDGLANSGSMQLGVPGINWAVPAPSKCLSSPNYQVKTPSSDCAAVLTNF